MNDLLTSPIQYNQHTLEYYEYYWKIIIIIGCYYILPALQFVFFQAYDDNVDCFYNNKCKNSLYNIPSFNSVISNIFYVIFGIIFIFIVKYNNRSVSDGITYYGENNNRPLYYSLGVALILEGFCSSIYHICPSKLNFQFDTTFMFIGIIIMGLTIHQKKNNCIPPPFKLFMFLSLIILINILPIIRVESELEIWFWCVIFIFVAYFIVFGTIYLYYDQEYDLDVRSLITLSKKITSLDKKNLPKFVLICTINIVTLSMYIYATIIKPDFTNWFLGLSIINMIIYFIYYLISKIINRERLKKIWWFGLFTDIIIITLSLVYFNKSVNNRLLTIEESNKLNKPCVLFGYFDYHDIWHILSATGLFLFMNIIYFMDNMDNMDNI
jgi:hypothetical protein